MDRDRRDIAEASGCVYDLQVSDNPISAIPLDTPHASHTPQSTSNIATMRISTSLLHRWVEAPVCASLAVRAVVGPLVDVSLLGRAEEDVVLILVSFREAREDGSAGRSSCYSRMCDEDDCPIPHGLSHSADPIRGGLRKPPRENGVEKERATTHSHSHNNSVQNRSKFKSPGSVPNGISTWAAMCSTPIMVKAQHVTMTTIFQPMRSTKVKGRMQRKRATVCLRWTPKITGSGVCLSGVSTGLFSYSHREAVESGALGTREDPRRLAYAGPFQSEDLEVGQKTYTLRRESANSDAHLRDRSRSHSLHRAQLVRHRLHQPLHRVHTLNRQPDAL
jgi:hypothetical protein